MSGDLMREALEQSEAALQAAEMSLHLAQRRVREALAQAEQRGGMQRVWDVAEVAAKPTLDFYAQHTAPPVQAEQRGEAIAEIVDGDLSWFIPNASYALDGKFRTGRWMLYTAPPAPVGTVTGWFIRNGRTIYTIATASGPVIEMVRADEAPAVPEGWKLVPLDPTPAMEQASCKLRGYQSVTDRYRAMVCAAPEVPHG